MTNYLAIGLGTVVFIGAFAAGLMMWVNAGTWEDRAMLAGRVSCDREMDERHRPGSYRTSALCQCVAGTAADQRPGVLSYLSRAAMGRAMRANNREAFETCYAVHGGDYRDDQGETG
ncbi:hypothetical protein [Gymnodinialimonas ceratoperidinii]|uniref:Uncharacterized protein n=1 Tax=Gymnodinialimonas ceratoperidinii TaxID=2856823 RepID=A0A8F6TYC8_9RHOB|nr:hypothetical protein [Gymnodinialimonas ceratoperidinii]QXT40214.1 hypothetical protein KYE46_02850 [Gymnodinialimonas ceratoperidinii]